MTLRSRGSVAIARLKAPNIALHLPGIAVAEASEFLREKLRGWQRCPAAPPLRPGLPGRGPRRYREPMFSDLIAFLAGWVKGLLDSWGYLGIVLAMAIESACIPLPSEVIMPTAGVLVSEGKMNFHLAAFAGAVGNLLGSWVAYFAGAWGGRPFLEKYGKYILITRHDLEIADKFFARFGDLAAFLTRCMPVVRTFISLPAGISRMRLATFSLYTLLGSWIWSYLFTYIGIKLGENLEPLRRVMHRLDLLIGVLLIAGVSWWIWRHLKGLDDRPDASAAAPAPAAATRSATEDPAPQA